MGNTLSPPLKCVPVHHRLKDFGSSVIHMASPASFFEDRCGSGAPLSPDCQTSSQSIASVSAGDLTPSYPWHLAMSACVILSDALALHVSSSCTPPSPPACLSPQRRWERGWEAREPPVFLTSAKISALLVISCAGVGMSLNPQVPAYPSLYNRNTNSGGSVVNIKGGDVSGTWEVFDNNILVI